MKKKVVSKKLASRVSHPFLIGKNYLIRTVTHYYLGKLVAVFDHELLLNDASWVASTGRYFSALRDGVLDEVEPCNGPAIIGRGAIVDAVEWKSTLILVQK